MSTTKQTRCPHCSSVFNITDEQLAALPDLPGRQALASLVEYTVTRHG